MQTVVLFWENEFRIQAAGGRQGGGRKSTFAEGEEVFVVLKSDKATGRAKSMQSLEGDRYRVVYDEHRQAAAEDGQNKTFDVRSARIIHVVDRGACCIIVCGPTQDFRYLCRTQVTCEDTVLEIGCSYGKASKVLAEQLGLDSGGGLPLYNGGGGDRLICVDISSEGISACKILNKDATHTRFVEMDVLDGTGEAMLSLYRGNNGTEEGASPFPTLVFLDIGGNREAEDVRALVPIIQRVFAPSLRQIIIKSEQVYDILKRQRWGCDGAASVASGGGIDTFESTYFSTVSTRGASSDVSDQPSGYKYPGYKEETA